MSFFKPHKLHVTFVDVNKDKLILPRTYTLTHSDRTGDLFLTIAKKYNSKQISHWYVRFMRDEVLGEWKEENNKKEIHFYFHICGGFIFGWAKLRNKIIRSHMKLVFEAIRYGERRLIDKNKELDKTLIKAHFKSKRKKFNTIEDYGLLGDYKI